MTRQNHHSPFTMTQHHLLPGIRPSLVKAVLGDGYVTPRVEKKVRPKAYHKPAPEPARKFPDDVVLEVRRLWHQENLDTKRIANRMRALGYDLSDQTLINWVGYKSRKGLKPMPNAKPYLQPKPVENTQE